MRTMMENEMSCGVLLNNRLISKLYHDDVIQIKPWNPDNLQLAQYALNPLEILYEDGEGNEQRHALTNSEYIFQPNEYAKVMIEQKIILPDGIVGRFIPASGLIETGFGITLGKLDPAYGQSRETIQFGIKNLRNKANKFSRATQFTSRVAYIEFFDLRTSPADPAEATAYDYAVWEKRRMREEFTKKGISDEW